MQQSEFNKIKKQLDKDIQQIETSIKWDIKTRDYVIQRVFEKLKELNNNLISNKHLILKIKSMEYMTEALIKFNKVDLESQIISIYKNSTTYFEETNINFYGLIYEKIYIDNYQYFELYISNLFQKLYTAFPAFLLEYKDKKYNDTSIELNNEVKDHIENKVKILMHSNIYETIDKFKNIFGIDINSVKEKDKKDIFTISQNRNLLIHNNGIVNNTYLNNLRQKEIISKYSLGDKLNIVEHDEIEQENKVIINISQDLTSAIMDNWDDITIKYLKRIK